jgi:hypothetical protein
MKSVLMILLLVSVVSTGMAIYGAFECSQLAADINGMVRASNLPVQEANEISEQCRIRLMKIKGSSCGPLYYLGLMGAIVSAIGMVRSCKSGLNASRQGGAR